MSIGKSRLRIFFNNAKEASFACSPKGFLADPYDPL